MALRYTLRHESRAAKDPGFRILYVTFSGAGAFRPLNERNIAAFRPGPL